MKTWIALLRGINVGGNNLIAMAELRKALEEGGCKDVRTLLQSGNVVLSSEVGSPGELEAKLEAITHRRFGLKVDFVARSISEWTTTLSQNPFLEEAGSDPSHLLVHFLKGQPKPSELESFAAGWKDVEQVRTGPKALYVYFPKGIGKSKLKIPFPGTARNWNTVVKLAGLAMERDLCEVLMPGDVIGK